MTQRIKQYLGRDNPSLVTLAWAGVTLTSSEMDAITRVDIKYKGSYLSSDDFPALFDWSTYKSTGQLKFDLGSLNLPADRDDHAEIMAYDSTYTNGRVVGVIELTISDEAQPDGTLTDVLSYHIALGELSDVISSSAVQNDFLMFNGSRWIPSSQSYVFSSALSGLSDVDVASVATDDFLMFNGSLWVPGSYSYVFSANLDAIKDVEVSGASANDFFMFNGSQWVPGSYSYVFSSALDGIKDVQTSGAVADDFLMFNGSDWVPGSYSYVFSSALDGLSDAATSGAALGDALTFNGSLWVPGSHWPNISSLAGVDVSSAVAGLPLTYTGSNFQPIVLDEPAANGTARGEKMTATAGADFVFGDLAYLDFSDGTYKKAIASGLATMPCVRMAAGTISTGSKGIFLVSGVAVSNSFTLTGSRFVYVSPDSAGLLTQNNSAFTTGEFAQVIGSPVTSNTLFFRPSGSLVELS